MCAKVRKIVSRNWKYNRGNDLVLESWACLLIILLGQRFFNHIGLQINQIYFKFLAYYMDIQEFNRENCDISITNKYVFVFHYVLISINIL